MAVKQNMFIYCPDFPSKKQLGIFTLQCYFSMKMGHFNGGVQPLVMYAQVLLDCLIRLLSFFY